MKFKINYSHEGSSQLLTKVIETTHEKDAIAIFHDIYGSNRTCKIFNVIPQPDIQPKSYTKSHEYTDSLRKQSEDEKKKKALSYLSESKKLSGSGAALALASEAADKLAAYNDRQKSTASSRKQSEGEKKKEAFPYFNEQDHIWFYTIDNENIKGPFVFPSILRKIEEGTLQEDSLVMKAGNDWMTVSAFKKIDTASVAAPKASFTQKSTDNLRKPSEDEKKKEVLPYLTEPNGSLRPTAGDKLNRSSTAAKAAFKKTDNSISIATKDKLTFFGLGLLYWIAISPMIISGAIFASESGQSVIIWPLLTILGMMASPLWLFICWGSSCTQQNQDVLVILSWIIVIEFTTLAFLAAFLSKDTKDI